LSSPSPQIPQNGRIYSHLGRESMAELQNESERLKTHGEVIFSGIEKHAEGRINFSRPHVS
jgi:hypothetical protein